MFGWFRSRRRDQLKKQPMPLAWREILSRRVRHYSQLDEAHRSRLEDCVKILAAERAFEGCGGLTLTDEIRITVCGQASLLLLGVDGYYFDRLPSILIYPESYVRPGGMVNGMIVDEDQEYAGEAWRGGPIVLSWRDVLQGGQHAGDGHNVVLHEFAHHLDGLDGEMGGQPPIDDPELRRRWSAVVEVEFGKLVNATRRGEPTLIDDYGATNPAEFFAVSTECFFEAPRELRQWHSEWYKVLSEFYQVDPALWDWT